MKNKKGFTLVELLAVIVILALIMGIAVVSIGGILNSTRESTFKETAVSIINGVRQELTITNTLSAGNYAFSKNILEKGGDKSPLGGDIVFNDDGVSGCSQANKIGDKICKLNSTNTVPTASNCTATTKSFVHVQDEGNNVFTYYICLTAGTGNKFIQNGKEVDLLDSNKTTMIK